MNLNTLISKTAELVTKGCDTTINVATTVKEGTPELADKAKDKCAKLKREAKFAWMEGVNNARS